MSSPGQRCRPPSFPTYRGDIYEQAVNYITLKGNRGPTVARLAYKRMSKSGPVVNPGAGQLYRVLKEAERNLTANSPYGQASTTLTAALWLWSLVVIFVTSGIVRNSSDGRGEGDTSPPQR